MASFSNELSQQSWGSVLKTDDVNQPYNSFLHIFMDIFSTLCSGKVHQTALKILRITERNYYSLLQKNQKPNVKETLKILNEVIF